MVKRNRHRTDRKKRATIEAFRKRKIPIIHKDPVGHFHLGRDPRPIEQKIESSRVHKSPVIEQEVPRSAILVDLTEDDSPSPP